MSDGTGIEWTDATWNPTVGCTKVSPGCDHCYAETFVNPGVTTSQKPDSAAPEMTSSDVVSGRPE